MMKSEHDEQLQNEITPSAIKFQKYQEIGAYLWAWTLFSLWIGYFPKIIFRNTARHAVFML